MADVAALLVAIQTGSLSGERDLLYTRLGNLPKGFKPESYERAKEVRASLDELESKRKNKPRLGNMIDKALRSLPLKEDVDHEGLAEFEALKDSVRKIEAMKKEALELYLKYMSAMIKTDTLASAAIGQAAQLVTKVLKI